MKNFKKTEQEKQTELIQSKNPVFYGSKGGGRFMGKPRPFVLQDGQNNIFKEIQNDVLGYFNENEISWWGGKKPTGHVLSSQMACLNHLFAIKNDKDTVLKILNEITKKSFTEVLKINCDEKPEYISFEVVSKVDHLNEEAPTRGSNCTSIDAFILAKQNDETWMIPIEWKYTEHYGNTDKSAEKRKDKITGKISDAGSKRLKRYTDLINKSNQLQSENHKDYYFEPFYQLMRQTLWAEQMIANEKDEVIKAKKFLHLHVIPKENHALLGKIYKCSKKNMEKTWRNCLKDQSKYLIVYPSEIVNTIKETGKYNSLVEYLNQRYQSKK